MKDTGFFMPTRLIVGDRCIQKNTPLFHLGRSCLIVTGKNSARASGALEDVTSALAKEGVSYRVFDEVGQNPLLSACVRGGETARSVYADFIVGIGGGSPLDAAKAVAIFATNQFENPADVFACRWTAPALPVILVGTTAGTGSEVTPYSVITVDETNQKRSISDPQCFALAAFGDPRYTEGLSEKFTVSTALDALSHCIESYFNKLADPMTDLHALEGAKIINGVLSALPSGRLPDTQQRQALYLASIYAGLAIAKTGTCYCHSLGYFLSERHGIPHGVACAVYLPDFLERAVRCEPERADRFFRAVGTDLKTLCSMIGSRSKIEPVTLSDEEIAEQAVRSSGSKNFLNSPGTFDAEAATVVLKRLFTR